ncbi:hypothetical protein [Phenylobacterium sp.]|jgi:hypothetical protein|uniref:hypothetical protein n=1 Tax=Phenylobacterium sp. TaxID=1871053 RepID=UPI0035B36347
MSIAEAFTKSRTWALFACAAFGLAALLWFTKGFGSRDDGVAIVLNLRQDGSWAQSAPFRPETTGNYRVSLELKRRFPYEVMECLADVGAPDPDSGQPGRRPDCPTGYGSGQLEWSLQENGRPAKWEAFGPHFGEYSRDIIGRSLGSVDLDRRSIYVLRARLKGASPAMATVEPTFRIAFDDMASLIVSALFYSVAAFAVAFAGLGFAAQAVRSRRGEP